MSTARLMEERYWQARLRVLAAMARCRDARDAWRDDVLCNNAYEDLRSAEQEVTFRVDVAERAGIVVVTLGLTGIPTRWLDTQECAA